MKALLTRPIVAAAAVLLLAAFAPAVARADADEVPSASSTSLGLHPLSAPIPVATPAPGESAFMQRPDGAYQAIPRVSGRTKTFADRRASGAVDAQARP